MARLKYVIISTYYRLILWWEDFGSDADITRSAPQQREQHRRNETLARGVKHLVKWMRGLSPAERRRLIEGDANLLMKAGRAKDLSSLERMLQAQATEKLVRGPREESEEAMAKTFVKNQEKYKLQARRTQIYRDLRDGKIDPKVAKAEVYAINMSLKKL